jgi:hypothetical protein
VVRLMCVRVLEGIWSKESEPQPDPDQLGSTVDQSLCLV